MDRNAKIYVAGHRGLVGSAILAELKQLGYQNFVFKTSSELNLTDQSAVRNFFASEKPEYVFMAAAKVGGILANRDEPTEFLYENNMIAMNVTKCAADFGVKKLLMLGSSCIYPKNAPQPIKEESILTSPLERTNEAYAIAKIAALKLTEYYYLQHGKDFISVMPPNMYGPGDNFSKEKSHVIPGLMRRFHEAKTVQAPVVTVWGSGQPLREFLYSADLGGACVFAMLNYSAAGFINLGSGEEVSIRELAELIKTIVGYEGRLEFDSSKPDGTPRKLMDSSKIRALGWTPKVSLKDGLRKTYDWYLNNAGTLRN